MTPLPELDVSSPEKSRNTLAAYYPWMDITRYALTEQQARQAQYVRCVIDAMRFSAAHESKAMKEAAQEAIDKLKASLADSGR